jgi:cysteine desulfuration protein SufE
MDKQAILDAFQYLETWEERYQLISELERELVPLDEADRTDVNRIAGCTTRTWLTGELADTDPPTLVYRADAEGPLVRGLVALLLIPFQGHTPAEVVAMDPRPYIQLLGLESALSQQRRAGMYAFLERVRQIALDKLPASAAASRHTAAG